MNKQQGILLESGTNEVEFVEFAVGTGIFGINVMKVREVVALLPITKIPNSHHCVEGIIHLRNEVITLVDLAQYLGHPESDDPTQDRIIVAEFNLMKVAFRVHQVFRIHRISWKQMEKPPDITETANSSTIGVIKMPDRMILLLDFEKIMRDINPEGMEPRDTFQGEPPRVDVGKKIMVAEDSKTLREILKSFLPEAGYSDLQFFHDGAQAWARLEELATTHGKKFTDHVNLLITDIEMPQMDGHHLTKKVKEHPILKELPVVIFSSLITDELRHKGEKVGASAQISKPEYKNLAFVIGNLAL